LCPNSSNLTLKCNQKKQIDLDRGRGGRREVSEGGLVEFINKFNSNCVLKFDIFSVMFFLTVDFVASPHCITDWFLKWLTVAIYTDLYIFSNFQALLLTGYTVVNLRGRDEWSDLGPVSPVLSYRKILRTPKHRKQIKTLFACLDFRGETVNNRAVTLLL